jgi:hypothetical protein
VRQLVDPAVHLRHRDREPLLRLDAPAPREEQAGEDDDDDRERRDSPDEQGRHEVCLDGRIRRADMASRWAAGGTSCHLSL